MINKEEGKNVKNVPNLRFPGFEGSWKNEVLENIIEFKVTNSFSRDNLNYENGKVKNIHYGDIHTKYSTLYDILLEKTPFINEDINLARISEANYCLDGDVIFADASEDLNDVGKSIEIVNLNGEKLLAGLHTLLARPCNKIFHSGFAGYLFKSSLVRRQIKNQAQGSKVLAISAGRISKIQLHFPPLEEQKRISLFLKKLDERILTQSKIIEELLTQIKSISESLFYEKIKFMDDSRLFFSGWNYVKGNEVFENISNKNHNSNLPILAITQEYGAIPRNLIDYQISVTEKSVESYKVVQKGDFIISLRSFQGGIEYSDYTGLCSPAYIVLKSKIDIDNCFYRFYLRTNRYIKALNSKLEGIRDGKMISYKYFSDIPLPYPLLDEQIKIGKFLSLLEEKLDLEKQLLISYKQQKKWFLNSMLI